MGTRGKQARFDAIKQFDNVFDFAEANKGKWSSDVFHNDDPLILELTCGKGEYTRAMATRDPHKNYVGCDIKGERLYIGAKDALNRKLTNVAFLRALIEGIDLYFGKAEVDEIWITFPDPFPKRKQMKHRVTAPSFIELYKRILKPGGALHLKTDSLPLLHYSAGTLDALGFEIERQVEDIYTKRELPHSYLDIQTNFEGKHLAKGRTINYLRARYTPVS